MKRTSPATVLLSALCLAACSAPVDERAESDGEDLIIPIPLSLQLTFDGFDGATMPLVEGRPAIARFTLTNTGAATHTGRVAVTIAPHGAAPYDGDAAWLVYSLGQNETIHGVVPFTLPTAAKDNQLTLTFTESAATLPSRARTTSFPTAARFTAAIDGVRVDNPRSIQADSDYLGFAARGSQRTFADARSIGTAGGGVTLPGLANEPALDLVPDLDTLTETLVVVNWGSPLSGTPSLDRVKGAAAELLWGRGFNPIDPRGLLWNDLLPGITLADCDGPIAGDKIDWTARSLVDATSPNPAVPTPTSPVVHDSSFASIEPSPGKLVFTKHYPGYPSSFLCGAESNYDVTYSIGRVAAGDDPVVRVSPALKQLRLPFQFTSNLDVDWSVDGGPANGFIDATGRYTPPPALPTTEVVIVRATARDGSGRSGVAYVSGAPASIVRWPPVVLGG